MDLTLLLQTMILDEKLWLNYSDVRYTPLYIFYGIVRAKREKQCEKRHSKPCASMTDPFEAAIWGVW